MTGLEMKYFVLKPKGNDPYAIASRHAMRAYANKIILTNRELGEAIQVWMKKEEDAYHKALMAEVPENENRR